MSINRQLVNIQSMYSKNIKSKGVTSESVGWSTKEGHALRYKKLTQVIDPEDISFSVNDFGCGYAGLIKFLEQDLLFSVSEYNGYDISSEMLEAAAGYISSSNIKARINLLNNDCLQSSADYSFVCGTFNVKFDATDAEWEIYIRNKIIELSLNSVKGFSFNLLSTFVDWKKPNLYYGNPSLWFEFCKNHISNKVSLLHDYPLWEWTILVYKD